MQLTEMSRSTGLPISTLHERLRRQRYIKRFTCLTDFTALGFTTRAHVLVAVGRHDKDRLRGYLHGHPNVNTLFRVNNGFDFLFEGIFTGMPQVEDFFDALEKQFSIKSKIVHYVLEEIKQEEFLSTQHYVDWVIGRE